MKNHRTVWDNHRTVWDNHRHGKVGNPRKGRAREAPNSVADPKPCIHTGPTPSSPANRTEPIFELLPTRELGYSSSSIELTACHNNKKTLTEELTKSGVSMTYRSQCPGSNPKLLNIKKQQQNNPFSRKKTINGDYQATISKLLNPSLRT